MAEKQNAAIEPADLRVSVLQADTVLSQSRPNPRICERKRGNDNHVAEELQSSMLDCGIQQQETLMAVLQLGTCNCNMLKDVLCRLADIERRLQNAALPTCTGHDTAINGPHPNKLNAHDIGCGPATGSYTLDEEPQFRLISSASLAQGRSATANVDDTDTKANDVHNRFLQKVHSQSSSQQQTQKEQPQQQLQQPQPQPRQMSEQASKEGRRKVRKEASFRKPGISLSDSQSCFSLVYPGANLDSSAVTAACSLVHGDQPKAPELNVLYGAASGKAEQTVIFSFLHRDWTSLQVLRVFTGFLVCTNTIFTAVHANMGMKSAVDDMEMPQWVPMIDKLFLVAFTLEIAVKALLVKQKFWRDSERYWNYLDILLVVVAFLDQVRVYTNLSLLRMLLVLRPLHVFRALRGMRSVRNLRMMLASIGASFTSLLWGIALLFFVMFVFSIGIMHSILLVHEHYGGGIPKGVWEKYGTVGDSIVTLCMAVTGGADWADLLRPLLEVSKHFTGVYIVFIFVVLFGLMNVLTAVFCENSTHIAAVDKSLVILEEMDRARSDVEALRNLLSYADINHDGKIGHAELETFLAAADRQAMLRLLAVDVAEARGLFDLLDADDSGKVRIDDFMDALLRLKGATKGIDSCMQLFETRRVLLRLSSFICYADDTFQMLFKELNLNNKVSFEQYIDNDFFSHAERDAKLAITHGLISQLPTRSQRGLGD